MTRQRVGGPAGGTKSPAVRARLLALLAAAGLASLLVLRHDYGAIERTLRWPLTDPGEESMPWAEVIPRMTELRKRTAYAPWIDYALAQNPATRFFIATPWPAPAAPDPCECRGSATYRV